jgi:hypothetical protein
VGSPMSSPRLIDRSGGHRTGHGLLQCTLVWREPRLPADASALIEECKGI